MKQPPDPPSHVIIPDGLLDPDNDDDEDDDEDDDDDVEEDPKIRQDVLDRMIPDSPQAWHKIASTNESVTVALDARVGCLVRVISWDLDGRFHMTTTWCHGVRIEDLQRGA